MPKSGPIIIVEDDTDDQDIMQEVLRDLHVSNPLRYFKNGKEALDYLYTTTEHPFLILCDINMPVMDGLELYTIIDKDPVLKEKNIPFIYLTTTGNPLIIRKAYNLTVQGFFQKKNNLTELRDCLKMIIEYWRACLNPNSV
jgi:CheY-like chemotaxis protein